MFPHFGMWPILEGHFTSILVSLKINTEKYWNVADKKEKDCAENQRNFLSQPKNTTVKFENFKLEISKTRQ